MSLIIALATPSHTPCWAGSPLRTEELDEQESRESRKENSNPMVSHGGPVGLCLVHVCGPTLAACVCGWFGVGPWACLLLRYLRLGTALLRASVSPLHTGLVLAPLSSEGMSSLSRGGCKQDGSAVASQHHFEMPQRSQERLSLPWAEPGSL